MALTPIQVLLGLIALYLISRLFLTKSASGPLPPGPSRKPIVGNLSDLPSPGEQDWKHWLKYKDSYGPISSISVPGQTIIIVNDSKIAFDLLEKRSSVYSSRPRMVFASKMVGWENGLATQTYSDRFRAYRKAMHRTIGSKVSVMQFNPLQEVEVRRFLLRVLNNPDGLIQHIRTEAGAVILKIAYGYTIEPHKADALVDLANEVLEQFSIAATPGTWLVDTIPILKHIPTWFPGAEFKRIAKQWRKMVFTLADKPYAFVHHQMSNGAYKPSYVSHLMEERSPETFTEEEEHVVKWSAASLYAGGADTTVSSLACFYLAMAIYPEVQRKAQQEIDRVVGPNKLPTFADRERLPYINAVVKEVLRWHPVAPMGLPHTTTQDDVYEGYFIPKGSMVLANIWGFTHDPNVYPDPMTFKPERFLEIDSHTPELDPHTLSFGFGRRVCPGKLLADATIFLSVAQSLAVFNFRKGAEDIQPKFLPGVISHPAPYKLSITPRSPEHEKLIRSVEVEHPWEESDAATLEKVVY
ncbi:cytochrome P450 [Aspergillus thermomutatus]|uniref:O-methylsterigmatocystin oxidoreductase n=1 Tax=Aspergillus thermomutatus TaxID=41047 RepID=A0A397GCZ1_ASPTH|nr:uncharacterized protein CDV56_102662 [Aspergillus thermomutatus]RHZ47488.1 hypothetical protein CDV56_102662 [Aspergillus thermomutatus]